MIDHWAHYVMLGCIIVIIIIVVVVVVVIIIIITIITYQQVWGMTHCPAKDIQQGLRPQ